MKQKTSSSQTLTKQDLIDTLKDFKEVTQQDLIDALKDFRKITQQDITDALKNFRKDVIFDIDLKLDHMELRMEDRAREKHSEVLSRFDSWAGELETAREDRVITTKQLTDHETRIKKLERAQN